MGKVSFSDDRRFIAGTMDELVKIAKNVEESSRRLGRIVHPDIQAFAYLQMNYGNVEQVIVPVPGYHLVLPRRYQ